MFEVLLFIAIGIAVLGLLCALDGSRDVFHPLVFIGPMLAFLYGWMPWKLFTNGAFAQFLDTDQLTHVQTLNILGVLAFVLGCLATGVRLSKVRRAEVPRLSAAACRRLLLGAGVAGAIGLLCWGITIINVGGFVNAYSTSYSGGWDDSGYVRDGSLLLLTGVLLAVTSLSSGGPRLPAFVLIGLYGFPWLSQALLMARRGPTFAFVIVVLMGWYINRNKRPPILAVGALGFCLGWLVLFLVTNRGNIYLGSSFEVSTDVSDIVEKPDTGNEYIYGAGTVLSAERRDHYFWMRRYLAQILVRPIPSAIWPTKYEDFGVPRAAPQRRHRRGLRRCPRLERSSRLRARHRRRSFCRALVARHPCHGRARLALRLRVAKGGHPWRPLVQPVRHPLRGLHLPRHADDGGGHLPHHSALHPLLDHLALGSPGPRRPSPPALAFAALRPETGNRRYPGSDGHHGRDPPCLTPPLLPSPPPPARSP